jgi:signal transduction histidine kinase
VQAQLEQVRASRARIVEAGDAERRRLERDLHDGTQQRLVTLSLALGLALGLADRVASVGGVLRVDSPPGCGTQLEADLPCP